MSDEAADKEKAGLADIRVFISSASDVAAEREIAQDLIENHLAKSSFIQDRARLIAARYEDPDKRAVRLANLSPQNSINEFMGRPADFDIVIGILWHRMGTPLETPKRLDGTQYLSGTEWELENALAEDSKAKTLIFRNVTPPPSSWDKAERDTQNEQIERVMQFVKRLKSQQRSVLRYTEVEEFREQLRQQLDGLLSVLLKDRQGLVPLAKGPAFQGNPYPGLQGYDAKTRSVFFGRDREIADLRAWVVDPGPARRMVAVTGPSGSGKSSFVKAGLVPRLEDEGWITQVFRLTSSDSIASLAEILASMNGDDAAQMAVQLRADPAAIRSIIDQLLSDRPRGKFLAVIDQFEELLALSAENREAVLRVLQALQTYPKARVVTTLRADFVPEVTCDERLAKWLSGNLFILPVPGAAALIDIVSQPAAKAGYDVAPDLCDALVSATTGEAGALPLLCFTLQRLVDVAGDDKALRLPRTGAEGVLGWALAEHIQEVEAGLDEAELSVLHDLFRVLVRVSEDGRATKRPVEWSALDDAQAQLASHLVARRLLTALSTDRGRDAQVELAHEALLTAWPGLAEWVEENRASLIIREELERLRRLRVEAGETSDLLASNWLISRAIEAVASSPTLLSEEQARFLRLSRAAQEAAWEREANRLDELVHVQLEKGDHCTAELLALEGLPRSRSPAERPLDPRLMGKLMVGEMHRRELACFLEAGSCVAFSPDGARLASGGDDGTVRLWDAATGAETARLEGHGDWVRSVAFSPDGTRLASGGDDGTVRLWDAATGAETARLEGHEGSVNSVAFSPDGARLASGGDDGTVRLWDAATGAETARLEGHEGAVTSVAFSPDGARLASGGEDGTVRLWDAATGAETARLEGHELAALSVAFSPDGARLASGGEDGTIRLWDAATGAETARLEGHEGWVRSVAFSPDGTRLASGGSDGTVRLWDAATGAETARLEGHELAALSVVFSSDGARLASGGGDGTVRLWDAATGAETARLEGHEGSVNSVAFSPDGTRLASGGFDGTVRLWDAATGAETARLEGHGDWVHSVAFSPDGARLASGGDDGTVRLWDAATGAETARLVGHERRVLSVAFSLDGARLASGGADGTVRLWDATTGAETARLAGHGDWVQSVAFSPDGARLASGDENGTIRLWGVATGAETARLEGHGSPVLSVAFSPDGTRLASGGRDGTARLWDAATGAETARLEGHETRGWGGVYSVAFSPDETRLASGGDDGTVRLWDAATGAETARLARHERGVRSVAFSPDGTRLASGGEDGTIRLWDVFQHHPVDFINAVRHRLPRKLTLRQRADFHLPATPG